MRIEGPELPFERMVDLDEMASILSVPRRTLYYWVTRNEVPFTKIGRHIRFAPSEVVGFFREKTAKTRAPCSLSSILIEKGFRSLTTGKRGLAEPNGVSNASR